MAKPEWGTKRICASCGARFYDLRREPIVCPKCETTFEPDQLTRLKRARTPVPVEAPKKAKPKTEDEALLNEEADLEDVEEVEDEDDDVLEDASDLSEDDDLEEIVVGVEKGKGED